MVDQGINPQSARKLTCLCAPTTHPGSFRCRFHRASDNHWLIPHGGPPLLQPSSSASKPAAKPSLSRLGNMVPSVAGVQKPCARAAATPTFSNKIGMESNQQRPSKFVSGSQPSKAGVFAAGNCQSMLRKMHSESPPPIFSI